MKRVGVAVLVVTLLWMFVCAHTLFPIGIPGEWTWPRSKVQLEPFLAYAIVGAGYLFALLLAWLYEHRADTASVRLCILLLISGLGMWFDYNALLMGRAGIFESVEGVFEEYTSGYLTEAIRHVRAPVQYTRDYWRRLEKDEDKRNHLDVRPPGNVIFSWCVLEAGRRGRFPDRLMHFLISQETHERGLAYSEMLRCLYPEFDLMYASAERIVFCFFLMLCVARLLILFALLVLLRFRIRNGGVVAVLMASGLYAPVVFLGHYDTMLYFWGSICVLLLALSFRYDRRFGWWGAAAGAVMTLSCMFSLAFLAMGFFAVLAYMLRRGLKGGGRRAAWLIGGGAAVLLLLELCGVRVILMSFLALRNNARFFEEAGRSALLWPPLNFLDLTLFEGAMWLFPVLMAIPYCWRTLRPLVQCDGRWRFRWPLLMSDGGAWLASLLIVGFLLCISTFSRGEMGRLFLFIMPLLVVCGAWRLGSRTMERGTRAVWLTCGYAAACLALSIRYNLALIVQFWGELPKPDGL